MKIKYPPFFGTFKKKQFFKNKKQVSQIIKKI